MSCNGQFTGVELKSEKLIVLFARPLMKLNKTKTINLNRYIRNLS